MVTFGGLVSLAKRKVQECGPPCLNLLIEAPLSAAFDPNDNPARRVCDTFEGNHRDWWYNAGAATLLAAGFLLRELHGRQRREVRLFEGFASSKSEEDKAIKKTDPSLSHMVDVLDLVRAVSDGDNVRIFSPEELRQPRNCELSLPFRF